MIKTWARTVWALLLALGSALCAPSLADGESAPSRIDLDQFKLSFSEDFDRLDISEWGCTTRWIAHTPWGGDFGSAAFRGPEPGFWRLKAPFPFETKRGILEIKARRRDDGVWESGMISAWDSCQSGFAQKYGYFEMRAKMPEGAGFWPAFWLIGVDTRDGSVEVDIFEHYTHVSDTFTTALIQHPSASGETPRQVWSNFNAIEDGLLARQFNTFGAEISEDETVFYFNREEIWRTNTPETFRQAMYPLVTFAMDKGFIDENTPERASMFVDYVKIYHRIAP